MVLKLEGNLISLVPKTLKEFIIGNPLIQSLALKFLKENVKLVEPKFNLYIGQGEYAVIPANDKYIKVLGSDEATTCHIIILKHPSGTVAVSHFDGRKNEDKIFDCMLMEISEIDGSIPFIDVYVVGGYQCDLPSGKGNVSEMLSVKLLNIFHKHECTINVRLWCTCELNTKYVNNYPYPHFNGLAINREMFEVFPALFENQNPNYLLRSASNWVDNHRIPSNIYDYSKNCVAIHPFFGWNKKYFCEYSRLSDEEILKYFSTSPKVEPPTFCNRLRNVFLLLASNTTDSLFPNFLPKVYTMNFEGEWIEQ